jgi:hypothetical protein
MILLELCMTSECIPMLKNRRGKHVGIEMIQGAGVHSYVNTSMPLKTTNSTIYLHNTKIVQQQCTHLSFFQLAL